MNKEIKKILDETFINRFGNIDGVSYFFSPSRINIIGEHIDYNGGKVFPCAIEVGTFAVARKNGLDICRLETLNLKNYGEISVDANEYVEEDGWKNYASGMITYLKNMAYNAEGFDVVIYGNIPNGAGLSSSASIELLFGVIINDFFNKNEITTLELVHAGVWCENEFFGLHSGIMDQYVIGFGKEDYAMVLDTSKEEHEYVPFKLNGAKIIIMNTNKRRELKDSKYNERRDECDRALVEINKVLEAKNEKRNVKYLCDLGEDDLWIIDEIDNPILQKRAGFAIKENIRVSKAVEALKNNDLEKLGKILRAGNLGTKEEYEVTGKELDAITEAANAFEGCYGARMTGAGFSGCAIAVVEDDKIEEFTKYVGKIYKEKIGRVAEFIFSKPTNGAGKIY